MTEPIKLKLDDRQLLDFVLRGMNTTRAQLEKTMRKEYALDKAEYMTTQRKELKRCLPGTTTPMYMDEFIYRCGNYLVAATKHGRVKKVTSNRPQPKVIHKRRRALTK